MRTFTFPPLKILLFKQLDGGVGYSYHRISVFQWIRYWWKKKRGGWVFVELDDKGNAVVR